jgi:hypothetical protein
MGVAVLFRSAGTSNGFDATLLRKRNWHLHVHRFRGREEHTKEISER